MAAMRWLNNRWLWACVGLIVAGSAAWCWLQRHTLLAHYYVRQLASAEEEDRSQCLEALTELGPAAIPPLIEQLKSSSVSAQVNCGWALGELARRWGGESQCTERLARCLAREYLAFDREGRRQTLRIVEEICRRGEIAAGVGEAAEQLLVVALTADDVPLRPTVLQLALAYVQTVQPVSGDGREAVEALARAGLKDVRPECRIAAIRLIARCPHSDLTPVFQLLVEPGIDPAAEVRYQALLTVGPPEHDQIAPTDDLFHLLHDSDANVAFLCARVLGSRGMTPEQIQLTRKMTHPDPAMRAQAPEMAFDFPSETKSCLARLCGDPTPAVRAAVLRAIDEFGDESMRDIVYRLAHHDADQTVRQIARYYLYRLASAGER